MPEYWGGEIPWMSSGEVKQRVVKHVAERITALGMANSNARLLAPDTIMMALNGQGSTRGKVALLKMETTCNQSLAGIIADRNQVCPEYLFHYLDSRYQYIRDLTGDDARNGLNLKILASLQVKLPPLDEQRRIAEVLWSVDEASFKAQEASHLEARLRDKLAGGLFAGAGRSRPRQETKIGTLPAHWSVSEWGSLCTTVGVGIASSATHAYSSEGIPLIRNQNILFGSLDLTDLLRVTTEYDQQYASKRLKTGDVVTMRTGYPGRSAVVPPELNGCQTFTTLISRPRQDVVMPRYLCGWINSERGRREVLRLQAGGAQQNLNAGSLRHLLVPVPPMEEQNEIVEMLQGFDRNQAIEQSFAAVRDAIRSDLLSGRVRVPA